MKMRMSQNTYAILKEALSRGDKSMPKSPKERFDRLINLPIEIKKPALDAIRKEFGGFDKGPIDTALKRIFEEFNMKNNPKSQGILTTKEHLLHDVSKFMNMLDKKIKVEIYGEADDLIPTVIITFPSKAEYLIGCDPDSKTMDSYRMKPKCFFASVGETYHSNSYYEPDSFEWVDIAVKQDDLVGVCGFVAKHEFKTRSEWFYEMIMGIEEQMYMDEE